MKEKRPQNSVSLFRITPSVRLSALTSENPCFRLDNILQTNKIDGVDTRSKFSKLICGGRRPKALQYKIDDKSIITIKIPTTFNENWSESFDFSRIDPEKLDNLVIVVPRLKKASAAATAVQRFDYIILKYTTTTNEPEIANIIKANDDANSTSQIGHLTFKSTPLDSGLSRRGELKHTGAGTGVVLTHPPRPEKATHSAGAGAGAALAYPPRPEKATPSAGVGAGAGAGAAVGDYHSSSPDHPAHLRRGISGRTSVSAFSSKKHDEPAVALSISAPARRIKQPTNLISPKLFDEHTLTRLLANNHAQDEILCRPGTNFTSDVFLRSRSLKEKPTHDHIKDRYNVFLNDLKSAFAELEVVIHNGDMLIPDSSKCINYDCLQYMFYQLYIENADKALSNEVSSSDIVDMYDMFATAIDPDLNFSAGLSTEYIFVPKGTKCKNGDGTWGVTTSDQYIEHCSAPKIEADMGFYHKLHSTLLQKCKSHDPLVTATPHHSGAGAGIVPQGTLRRISNGSSAKVHDASAFGPLVPSELTSTEKPPVGPAPRSRTGSFADRFRRSPTPLDLPAPSCSPSTPSTIIPKLNTPTAVSRTTTSVTPPHISTTPPIDSASKYLAQCTESFRARVGSRKSNDLELISP